MIHDPVETLLLATVLSAVSLDVDTTTGAQMCVGESGWRDAEACVAEVYVLKRRADRNGWTFRRMAERYSAALRRAPLRRPWLVELRDRSTPPAHWPEHLNWPRHRRWLKALLPRVRHALLGDEPDPCPGTLHFGSLHLDGVPSGFRRSSCLPDSGQGFYEPGVEERRNEPARLYERVRVVG